MSGEVGEETRANGFVAVHIGAGYHSPANCELYKNICKQACQQAIQLLKQRKTALEAVTSAMVSLENSQWTNAGLGSNLSLAGTVECDASIMDGTSLNFGAVGALSGVKNPILVAESLLQTQVAGEMSLGRVPPSTLVAHGAYDWAMRHQIPTCAKDDLITDASNKAYIKNKRKLDIFEEGIYESQLSKMQKNHPSSIVKSEKSNFFRQYQSDINSLQEQNHQNWRSKLPVLQQIVRNPVDDFQLLQRNDVHESIQGKEKVTSKVTSKVQKMSKEDELESMEQASTSVPLANGYTHDIFKDTVGAICVDESGAIASAVSSGGIILKQPGRLGQAALYGCGCWAENDLQGKVGVGVSTSGCGEQLSKTLLAKACGDCLKDQQNPTAALNDCFVKKFLESPYLKNEKQPLGGAVAVTVDSSNNQSLDIEVFWAHTTDSMCLAFMSSSDGDAKAFVSRLPTGVQAGKAVVIQSENLCIMNL